MLGYEDALQAGIRKIEERRAELSRERRARSQELFGHTGASVASVPEMTLEDEVRAVLDAIGYPKTKGTATVTHRGVTASVHVEDDPVVEGRVRVRLSAERTPWNAFSGLDADDLYSFGGLYPNDPVT